MESPAKKKYLYPWNAVAKIVCWHCRRGDRQLFRIKDSDGFKTEDYICVDCKFFTSQNPPIQNVSKMLIPKQLKKQRTSKDYTKTAVTEPSNAT